MAPSRFGRTTSAPPSRSAPGRVRRGGHPREARAPHHVGARARRRRRPPRRRRQQRRSQIWGALDLAPRYRGWSKVGGELLDPAAFAQTSAKLGLGDTPVEDLDYVEDDEEIDETALAEQTLSGWLTKRSGPFNVTRRRFFIITEGTLSWHKNERDLATALGAITLRDCTIADPDDGSCVVAIKAPEKNYELEADDPAACGEWVSALRTHARLPPSRLYTSSQTSSLVRRRPSPPRPRRPRRPARPRDPPARRALFTPVGDVTWLPGKPRRVGGRVAVAGRSAPRRPVEGAQRDLQPSAQSGEEDRVACGRLRPRQEGAQGARGAGDLRDPLVGAGAEHARPEHQAEHQHREHDPTHRLEGAPPPPSLHPLPLHLLHLHLHPTPLRRWRCSSSTAASR